MPENAKVRYPIEGWGDRCYRRPKEVATLVGLSEAEVYKSIYAGELRAMKYKGRAWLITEGDVAEWIHRFTEPNAA